MESIYKQLTNKPSVYVYGVALSLLSKPIYLYGFTIFLYGQDKSGLSSATTVLLGLIAVSLSGLFAPLLLRSFKGQLLGRFLVLVSLFADMVGYLAGNNKILIYLVIVVLFMIQGIESANYNFEVTSIFYVGSKIQIQTNNMYHTLSEFFSLIAPIIGFVLVNYSSRFLLVFIVMLIQLVPYLAWRKLRSYEKNKVVINKDNPGIIGIYKQVVQNRGVIYLNFVRTFNGFIFNIWSISVPLLIAEMSLHFNKHVSFLQMAYEVLASLSFVASGLLFSRFLQMPKTLAKFYRLVPFAGAFGVSFVLFAKTPISLYMATVVMGISVYFFRVGTATIGQIITQPELIAESIVLGDVFSRFVNFITTSFFFLLLHYFDYENVVIIFTVIGTVGNMMFVTLPLKSYEERFEVYKV